MTKELTHWEMGKVISLSIMILAILVFIVMTIISGIKIMILATCAVGGVILIAICIVALAIWIVKRTR